MKLKNNIELGTPAVINADLKNRLGKQDIHPKLSKCIIEMITSYSLPYYGEFCQAINFWEAKIGTCGVNVTEKGMNFYWDPSWMEKRTRKETIFTIIHEVFHLLFDHQKRGVGYDKKVANLAADMIINSIIHGDLMIGEGLNKMIEIPKDDKGNNSVVFLPKDYKGEPIFEEVYAWLLNEYNKWKNENSDKLAKKQAQVDKDGNITIDGKKYCGKCGKEIKDDQNGQGQKGQKDGQKDGQKNGQDGQDGQDGKDKCPQCGQEKGKGQSQGQNGEGEEGEGDDNHGYGNNGKSGEKGQNEVGMYPMESWFESIENNQGQSFDVHFDDDVPEAVRKQWVEANMERVKSRGLMSGDVEKILNKLRKTEKDYLKEIKRTLSNDIFGNKKNKSITKPHRRGVWGLKGVRKYKTRINVLLDTSGSMSGDFERVLSYCFQNDLELNLIQCDTEVKDFVVVKHKSELEKMKIQGLGGTTLTPGLQYIAQHKELRKLNNLILTDGYTDQLDFTGIDKKTLILSTGTECPVVQNSSKIKQIIIDKNKS